jgi:S-(hydroxymethyl)glutathione dehydrogenase/alcohol dehydrogenase
MKTKSAVLYEYGKPMKIEELELDKPKEKEVLIKYEAAGICHSDLSIMNGVLNAPPLPAILGHEGAGIVHEIGPQVTRVKLGDHVAALWVPMCGECYYCLKGQPYLCVLKDKVRGGTMLDGSHRLHKGDQKINMMMGTGTFSQYNVLSEKSVLPIDSDIPFDVASIAGCAVMTGVGAVLSKAKIEAGSSVAVVGIGGVGLNIIQGAVLANATTIIAIDILENKLGYAKDFGATHVINSAKEDPIAKVMDITGGIGADYSFEALGKSQTATTCFKLIRRGGTAVIVGIPSLDDNLTLPLMEFLGGKSLLGTYYGAGDARVQLATILKLYKGGRIKLDELITKRYSLEEINTGFADLSSGKNARGVVIL